ncbi:MoaD/ThiS family protein [Maribacter arcticus]|uniref:Molybdopterin synthase sulfur carrier subunit n=1 Tax=Maribacter arcticus TaxID=561365 RepID=A0A1T5BLV4_9FLAO|nr:MoaD/ThiS family protein [Maribacter arcticus]SKB48264.1 molybdopterin synthase sulfur carrier subunit [Maribacter arcticus]|tara:strand:+ start:3516 stop:3758 length:243 start_codon:yes stop_codon:yes gene_type:complete
MNVLFFGIAKDIVGSSQITFSDEFKRPNSVADLKAQLIISYPELSKLTSLAVAVNSEYAEDDVSLTVDDEIAIIPPVSGG